jgi:hypothetical protein
MFMVLALGLIFALPRHGVAQHFSVGMKAGVATLEPISVTGIFQRRLHPLIWGPVGELALPHSFGIEVSALHRQIAYRWQIPLAIGRVPLEFQELQEETHASSWEFPFVFKKYVHTASRLRAFGEAGMAIRHTGSTTNFHGLNVVQRVVFPPGTPTLVVVGSFSTDGETPELVSRWSAGPVIGAGPDIRIRSFRLQPELRYTRWSNSPLMPVTSAILQSSLGLGSPSVQSKRDSLDFSVGVLFTR